MSDFNAITPSIAIAVIEDGHTLDEYADTGAALSEYLTPARTNTTTSAPTATSVPDCPALGCRARASVEYADDQAGTPEGFARVCCRVCGASWYAIPPLERRRRKAGRRLSPDRG